MFFPEQIHSVEEDVGELFIPVHRSGDISQELMVVCYTQQGMDLPFLTSSNPFTFSVHCLSAFLLVQMTISDGEHYYLMLSE